MIHNYQACRDPDCEECDELIHDGVVMACDICDSPGLVSADHHSWRLLDGGGVACIGCAEKIERARETP